MSVSVAATPGTAFYSLGGYPAYGVSADGSTVAAGDSRWFVGSGQFDPLGPPPGRTTTRAVAVNHDGSILVGSASSPGAGAEAFEWTEDFDYEYLGKLGANPSPIQGSGATGVSADGSVVVGTSDTPPPNAPFPPPGEPRAFRWTPAEGMESLGTLPGDTSSRGFGVSADGSVIVGRSDGNNRSEAFRWTEATGMVGLGDLPGGIVASEAFAISADGSTIVGRGFDGTNTVAFRWTAATGMVSLGALPGGNGFSEAVAVSGDGSVVVGMSSDPPDEGFSGTDRAAFIWDAAHGMRSLQTVLADEYDLTLFNRFLLRATGISADGKVITADEGTSGVVVVLGQPRPTPRARIDGRHVFYNDSVFDGGNPAANAADDGAIAPDKKVLLPGQAATLENISTYSRGVNGVMIDVLNLPANRTLSADDFEFKQGNTATPASWSAAAAPVVTVRRSAVPEAPARVTLTWPGDNGPKNNWLKVTMKANADTGLADSDVFYVGSLVGETGDTSTPRVNAPDVIRTRAAQGKVATITSLFDFNRDGRVNVVDVNLVRGNQLARLYQFGVAPAGAVVVTPSRTAPTRRGGLASVTQGILREE